MVQVEIVLCIVFCKLFLILLKSSWVFQQSFKNQTSQLLEHVSFILYTYWSKFGTRENSGWVELFWDSTLCNPLTFGLLQSLRLGKNQVCLIFVEDCETKERENAVSICVREILSEIVVVVAVWSLQKFKLNCKQWI